jgi:PilZ domain
MLGAPSSLRAYQNLRRALTNWKRKSANNCTFGRETRYKINAMNKPAGQMDAESKSESQRSNNRNSLLLKAVLRFPASAQEREVRVRNLSSGGLMAEAPIQASRGEIVEINLKALGWITGKVAWVAESRFGIAFDYPVDPKAARQNVTSSQLEENMPHYLRKLNSAALNKPPLRRL